MRICLYSEKVLPQVGGQELVVDALARRLAALGHEPIVLAPRRRVKTAAHDANLPYRVLRHPKFFSTRYFVSCYGWWLARAHRRHGFDVLHCHGVYPTGYIAARCAATAGLPLVITSHGGDLDPLSPLYRKPQLRQRYCQTLQKAAAVVALSGFIEERLRAVCPQLNRVERIGNGVDLQAFSRIVAQCPNDLSPFRLQPQRYFLFLGRLVPRKGADLLAAAFARMKAGQNIDLVIAGSGRQEEELRRHIAAAGLHDRVHFVGEVGGEKKSWLLQNSLCMVMPSRVSEAFGLVALESFAAGRPVIAANIPGLNEMVEPGLTGLLAAENSPEELAEAMDAAAADPAAMDRLGRESNRRAQAFDWDEIARRHVELYEDVIRDFA